MSNALQCFNAFLICESFLKPLAIPAFVFVTVLGSSLHPRALITIIVTIIC